MSDPDALPDTPLPEERTRLVGHEAAFAQLLDRLAAGRLTGAVLLHGPQGIGKATLAFALARHVLAETGDESSARIGEQVAAGAHPNLAVLRRRPKDGKGHYTVIRVEDVRALRESLSMTRGRAGHRIALIDTIDDANANAANALLKTLEEPPPETLFLLVSHRPGALLPTIRSRCQPVALRALADAEVRDVLAELRPDAGQDALERAVALAAGRPRRGIEALGLDPESGVGALLSWLADPLAFPSGAYLALADALGATAQGPELSFAREILADWIAGEARKAALRPEARIQLASAGELWEKADALFAEADTLNLDMRQTLVAVFDAIRLHARSVQPAPVETR